MGYTILGNRPYPEISKDDFRDMWRHQTLYPRDSDSMRAELLDLKGRNYFQVRISDYDGVIVAQSVVFGEFVSQIERFGREVRVELKSLEEEEEEEAGAGSKELKKLDGGEEEKAVTGSQIPQS